MDVAVARIYEISHYILIIVIIINYYSKLLTRFAFSILLSCPVIGSCADCVHSNDQSLSWAHPRVRMWTRRVVNRVRRQRMRREEVDAAAALIGIVVASGCAAAAATDDLWIV